MQLTTKEVEYLLGFVYNDPETKQCETPPGTYELNDNFNAFEKSVELEADKKAIETRLTAQH